MTIGWSIHVDNSPAWKTTVRGSISIGAAALTRYETDFFENFIVVQNNPSDCPMTVEGEIKTFFEGAAEKTGRRLFRQSDFKSKSLGKRNILWK